MGKKRNSTGSGHFPESGTEQLSRLLHIDVSGGGESEAAAAQELRKLEAAEEYPLHLAEFIVSPDRPTYLKIFASSKLKNFVEAHWCATIENLRPAITVEKKTKIKELLLDGLSEPATGVREAVASIITTILPWEWPHDWPELIETLIGCLNGESENGVHGALLVLNNIDLTQGGAYCMQDVLIILRVINRIFANKDVGSIFSKPQRAQISMQSDMELEANLFVSAVFRGDPMSCLQDFFQNGFGCCTE